MITVGLTGSIGMGKSTVLAMFAELGAAVWDADAAVHRLYEPGGLAVEPVGEVFPDAIVAGGVDRKILAGLVLSKPEAVKTLEAIVHPLAAADREAFLAAAAEVGAGVAVLDIPLLFEGGADKLFDVVIVVSAPADVQRERVLARPGMDAEKFETILSMQTPDGQKRERADYVIETDQSIEQTRRHVEEIFDVLSHKI